MGRPAFFVYLRMKRSIIIVCSSVVLLLFGTCKKDEFKKLDCSSLDSKYSTSISGIISSNCTLSGCHNGSGPTFDLRTYDLVKAQVNGGAFESAVITNKTMPKGRSLSQDQRNKIKCWLDQGAPNN